MKNKIKPKPRRAVPTQQGSKLSLFIMLGFIFIFVFTVAILNIFFPNRPQLPPVLPATVALTPEQPGVDEVELADALSHLFPTEAASTGGSWQTYTTADGLPHNEISAIAIDGAGQVWAGSAQGLSKFDGQSWTTYSADGMGNTVINALAVDSAGHIWCATPGGLSEFDGQNWTTHLRPGNIVDNWVEVIAIDQAGRVWSGFNSEGGGGVGVFDGQSWTNYSKDDGLAGDWIQAIAVDLQGHIWVGYGPDGAGVSEFDGESWTTYTTADGLVHNWVNGIAIDPAGRKWFGAGAGVSRFSGESWATYERANGLAADMVTSIAISPAGQVWVGAFNGQAESVAVASGVRVFDGQGWTVYNESVGLGGDGVSDIAFDPTGQVWLATSGGVSRFTPELFSAAPEATTVAEATVQPTPILTQTRPTPAGDSTLNIYNLPLPDDAQALEYKSYLEQMSYSTPASIEQLITFYRRRLPEQGWQEEPNVTVVTSNFASLRFANALATLSLTLSNVGGGETRVTLDATGLSWEQP